MKPESIGAIVNPTSGDGAAFDRLRELASLVGAVEARITTDVDDVPEATRAVCEGNDAVAIVGGDGTIRDVAEALQDIDDPPPVFVVPSGRGNSTYRHLYGDREWQTIASGIATELESRTVSAGMAATEENEWLFVLGFTVGLFERGVEVASSLRWLPGRLSYVIGTVVAGVTQPAFEIIVEDADGSVFDGRAKLVAIGGGRYRGSSFDVLPDSRPGDADLHLLVLEPVALPEYPRLLRLATTGDHVDHPAVTYVRSTEFTLRSDGIGGEVDGTRVGTVTDVHAAVVPEALDVAYPAGL